MSTASYPARPQPLSRVLRLTLAGAALLVVGGCKFELASSGCRMERSDLLHVTEGQSCRFGYAQGDVAKYVVEVVRRPVHGEASGEGKYLHYSARTGFVGEDRLTIKVLRKGVGHVQWQTLSVRVVVGRA
ncbi:MAG: hypothetical protein IT536_01625 [Hyphomicrobiales bacterium]|nr:hypothetical protein [Hyphomicrobiales bacterium]